MNFLGYWYGRGFRFRVDKTACYGRPYSDIQIHIFVANMLYFFFSGFRDHRSPNVIRGLLFNFSRA